MDYKEEYEAMVKRCRELHESGNALTKQQMEIVCPQLKESYDERIRKEIHAYLFNTLHNTQQLTPRTNELERWLAYLEKQKDINCLACDQHLKGYLAGRKVTEEEKQKEQKPTEWSKDFEQNIRILLHDKLTWRSEDGSISSIVVIDDKTLKDIVTGIWFYVGKEANKYPNKELKVEQKPAEKQDYSGLNDLERAIHRAFLCAGVENVPVTIIKETARDCLAQMKPVEWSKEDKEMLERCISKMTNIIPVPGKHGFKDMSFEKHTDDELITWLKFLPERFSLQPKQEWSEEDKKNLQGVIDEIEANKNAAPSYDIPTYDRFLTWLKSLRPQPHWKPSEAELDALEKIMLEVPDYKRPPFIENLYAHLKQL